MQFSIVTDGDSKTDSAVFAVGVLTAQDSHPCFQKLLDAAYDAIVFDAEYSESDIIEMFNVGKAISNYFEPLTDRITIKDEELYYNGDLLDDSLARKALEFLNADVDNWRPLLLFYEKVQANPTEHSREQLYNWMKNKEFSLTEDGDIVMYKGVNNDLSSVFTGKAQVDGVEHTGHIPN
jgi:hypothetical protein